MLGSRRETVERAMRAAQHPYEWPGVPPAAVVLLLVAVAGRYGYHRDELYFLRADREPAFGYVDQPPGDARSPGAGSARAARARTLTGRRRAAAAVDKTLDEANTKDRANIKTSGSSTCSQ